MTNEVKDVEGVKTTLRLIAKGFLINTGAVMCMLIAIVLIRSWIELFKILSKLPNGLGTIGIVLGIVLLISCLRFPKTVGSWYETKGEGK